MTTFHLINTRNNRTVRTFSREGKAIRQRDRLNSLLGYDLYRVRAITRFPLIVINKHISHDGQSIDIVTVDNNRRYAIGRSETGDVELLLPGCDEGLTYATRDDAILGVMACTT